MSTEFEKAVEAVMRAGDKNFTFIGPFMAADALRAALPILGEALIAVVNGQWGEGPSSPYDNGATRDGYNVACNEIANALRAALAKMLEE